VVLSHFEGKKGSGKINAIHPKPDVNDQIEAIDNNFNMLTDAQSRSPSVSPKNTFRVVILNRLLCLGCIAFIFPEPFFPSKWLSTTALNIAIRLLPVSNKKNFPEKRVKILSEWLF
jgi:hypothetical protein